MHGTWIGWFRGHTGEIRYMVEHYIQDLDSVVVTGRSYTASKIEHGYWVSDAVALDAKKGQLMYTYSFNVLTQTAPLIGIHTSLLQRKSASAAPTGLAGFAHDLNDRFRSPVQSQKLDSDLVPWEEALDKAVAQFNDV